MAAPVKSFSRGPVKGVHCQILLPLASLSPQPPFSLAVLLSQCRGAQRQGQPGTVRLKTDVCRNQQKGREMLCKRRREIAKQRDSLSVAPVSRQLLKARQIRHTNTKQSTRGLCFSGRGESSCSQKATRKKKSLLAGFGNRHEVRSHSSFIGAD